MTKTQFFRKWITFLKAARKRTDLIGVIAALAVFAFYAPAEIFNSQPATGGDTGSHFWPLVTLVKEGLPHWHVRVWNPGNLGGEPHLTHYFPLPYLLMAFLSLFMPLGRAFNIGTFLPVFLLPACVYFCFRGLKARFPIPVLATVLSLSCLYNESFSMWGGNALSTLAGQFAHVYAIDFLLLAIGALNWEMDRKRFPMLAMFLFAGVLLSHFYVVLFIPAVFLIFLLFHRASSLKDRFWTLLKAGVGANLLAAWFVIPMLHNSKWNTAFGLKWGGSNLFNEAFPKIFWPLAAVALVLGLVTTLRGWKESWIEREWRLIPTMIFAIVVFGVLYYFSFPTLGLVDVRVIPTLQLVLCWACAFFLGLFLRQNFASVWVWFFTIPLIAVSVWWPTKQISNFPYWMKWNYSSWEAKKSYPDLMKISQDLKGDFSQGRVIYENSQDSNSAGTMRVFEMLPYFANRATLESVYMQATVLAPAVFYLQALISKSPSCPFPNYQCTSLNVARAADYLQLLGVTQLILITPEVLAEADHADFLKKHGDYDLWHLYDSKLPAPLVEVLKQKPQYLSGKNFKKDFYDWFLNYKKETPYLIQAPEAKHSEIDASITDQKCDPQLQVDFDKLKLTTDCPGKFHILKFAYHSTFQASTGDALYLTSPGFIGIIPSEKEVTLKWGQHWLWTLSDVISWMTLLLCFGWMFRQSIRKESKT